MNKIKALVSIRKINLFRQKPKEFELIRER